MASSSSSASSSSLRSCSLNTTTAADLSPHVRAWPHLPFSAYSVSAPVDVVTINACPQRRRSDPPSLQYDLETDNDSRKEVSSIIEYIANSSLFGRRDVTAGPPQHSQLSANPPPSSSCLSLASCQPRHAHKTREHTHTHTHTHMHDPPAYIFFLWCVSGPTRRPGKRFCISSPLARRRSAERRHW
ncbi:hypothetical protein LZ30DRAFT_43872 [Colletotrichum cereale]|nr:hypothetical protein LZ30DRAFT_43872 [Colletotrichum cereale]